MDIILISKDSRTLIACCVLWSRAHALGNEYLVETNLTVSLGARNYVICYNSHLKNRNWKHRKRNSTSNISRLNLVSCKTMKNYEGR